MAEGRSRFRPRGRLRLGLLLLAGVAVVALASVVDLAEGLFGFLATPPALIRAALAGVSIVLGGWLLLAAIRRIDGSIRRDPAAHGGHISDADLGALVRAVRLVFLAVASLTAAAGWLLGEPLPLVIALVIGGVDVVETSFLLLVATSRSR